MTECLEDLLNGGRGISQEDALHPRPEGRKGLDDPPECMQLSDVLMLRTCKGNYFLMKWQ